MRAQRQAAMGAVMLLSVAFAPGAHAHGAISERLADVEEGAAERVDDVQISMRRAQLYRARGRWLAALQEYQRLRRSKPELPDHDFYLGRAWLEVGHPELALPLLNRYLSVNSTHVGALVVRARAAEKMNDALAAAADLAYAIEHTLQPTPELYLQRAKLLVNEGGSHVEAGLRALDEGIARLGPLVTLVQYAVDVETNRRHYASALRRIETLPAHVRDSARWLARRGDIQAEAMQFAAADASYAAALAAIEKLPYQRRRVKAIMNLRARLIFSRGALPTLASSGLRQ